MVDPKERPIIFSGEMVRAILEDRKTQVRRVIKPQPPQDWELATVLVDGTAIFDEKRGFDVHKLKCPYGQPGDRLWVRETWGIDPNDLGYGIPEAKDFVIYRQEWDFRLGKNLKYHWGWNSSACMPRWASRIMLGIVNVRVERVQDISEEDAIAEGMLIFDNEWQMKNFPDYKFAYEEYLLKNDKNIAPPIGKTPRQRYAKIWDSINGKKYPWESNPWVWAIEFRKAEI